MVCGWPATTTVARTTSSLSSRDDSGEERTVSSQRQDRRSSVCRPVGRAQRPPVQPAHGPEFRTVGQGHHYDPRMSELVPARQRTLYQRGHTPRATGHLRADHGHHRGRSGQPQHSRPGRQPQRLPEAIRPSPAPPRGHAVVRRPPAPHRGCAASMRLGFDDVQSGDDHGTTAREHRSSTGHRLPPRHRAARWCGRSGPGCY